MPISFTYHFHKIKILEPKFSQFYFDLFKKLDYTGYSAYITNCIKNQLKNLILSGKETGVRIDPEVDIYKPLVKQGYPYEGVVYLLRELGDNGEQYLEHFGTDASLSLTPKGKKWAMDIQRTSQSPLPKDKLNYFNIPDAASPKLKSLLEEINNLDAVDSSANLIGHQLRTILILILKHVCKNILKAEIPADKQNLRPLLIFVIDGCAKQKDKRLTDDLTELKDSKYKDIIDDVIHDDHTTVNTLIVENMLARIKHILSLAYR